MDVLQDARNSVDAAQASEAISPEVVGLIAFMTEDVIIARSDLLNTTFIAETPAPRVATVDKHSGLVKFANTLITDLFENPVKRN